MTNEFIKEFNNTMKEIDEDINHLLTKSSNIGKLKNRLCLNFITCVIYCISMSIFYIRNKRIVESYRLVFISIIVAMLIILCVTSIMSISKLSTISQLNGQINGFEFSMVCQDIESLMNESIPDSIIRNNLNLIKAYNHYQIIFKIYNNRISSIPPDSGFELIFVKNLLGILKEIGLDITSTIYTKTEETDDDKKECIKDLLKSNLDTIDNIRDTFKLSVESIDDSYKELLQNEFQSSAFLIEKIKSVLEDYLDIVSNTVINDASANRFFDLVENHWLNHIEIDEKSYKLTINK